MRYKQAFTKMPDTFKQQFEQLEWAASLLGQGGDYADLLASRQAMACLELLLSERERFVLRLIVKQIGWSFFSLEMLEKQAASSRSGAEVHVALSGLRKYGIILAFRKSWGELLYVLPTEGFVIWQGLLLDQPSHRALEHQPPLLESIDSEPLSGSRGLAQELFALVSFAALHDLHLTAKGALSKKEQQQLAKLLRLPNIGWNRSGVTNVSSSMDETSLSLLLDFALRLGLLEREANTVKLQALTWSHWLCLSFEQQQIALYSLWRAMQVEPPLWLQHGMAVIENLNKGSWYSLQEMIRWFSRNEIPFAPLSFNDLEELLQQWIGSLHAFRWLECGKLEDGEVWFHWLIDLQASDEADISELQTAGDAFYVQPDFELLLPPSVPPYVEWEVALFADPVHFDDVRVYRITKQTFHRALESGTTVEHIMQFLSSHAIHQLPSGMEQALTVWGDQFGKLQFAEVTLLRARTPELAEFIRTSESCRAYIQSPIGDADFIVNKQLVPEFHKVLEQMGYHPQRPSSSKTPAASVSFFTQNQDCSDHVSAVKRKEKRDWLCPEDAYPLYELAPSLTDVEQLYPNLQDIPPLWLKEFREYHGSTRKDMIRKAIEWKSYLKLRKEGVERSVMPQRLQEDRSGWMLFGVEDTQQVTLRSEDWKEMKLMLPGINEP